MIYVTREPEVYRPSLLNDRGIKHFPSGLPVERATNLPGEKYWLCPFKGMPRDWREYGRLYELKEIRPATDAEIDQLPRKLIDRILLAADDSHLWPIRNRFNVTKKQSGVLESTSLRFAGLNIISASMQRLVKSLIRR